MMNTLETCLIEQQIHKIKSKVKSTIAQTSLFDYLKKTLTYLLNYPFNLDSRRIHKETLKSLGSLFELEEVHGLFEILGYTKENDSFIYTTCDENLKKLESCLNILEKNSLNGSRSFDGQKEEDVKPKSLCEINLRQRSPKNLKDFLLSRHLKKEQESHTHSSHSAKCSFTYNSNGHFSTQKVRQTKAFLLQKVFEDADFNHKKLNFRAQK